jgi:DNA-binding XRE family transcriptional regulator
MTHCACFLISDLILFLWLYHKRYTTERGVFHISLADIRRKRGLSQDQLAKLSGVHRVTIARFETGKISPKLKTLERLAAALGVPIGKIID